MSKAKKSNKTSEFPCGEDLTEVLWAYNSESVKFSELIITNPSGCAGHGKASVTSEAGRGRQSEIRELQWRDEATTQRRHCPHWESENRLSRRAGKALSPNSFPAPYKMSSRCCYPEVLIISYFDLRFCCRTAAEPQKLWSQECRPRPVFFGSPSLNILSFTICYVYSLDENVSVLRRGDLWERWFLLFWHAMMMDGLSDYGYGSGDEEARVGHHRDLEEGAGDCVDHTLNGGSRHSGRPDRHHGARKIPVHRHLHSLEEPFRSGVHCERQRSQRRAQESPWIETRRRAEERERQAVLQRGNYFSGLFLLLSIVRILWYYLIMIRWRPWDSSAKFLEKAAKAIEVSLSSERNSASQMLTIVLFVLGKMNATTQQLGVEVKSETKAYMTFIIPRNKENELAVSTNSISHHTLSLNALNSREHPHIWVACPNSLRTCNFA